MFTESSRWQGTPRHLLPYVPRSICCIQNQGPPRKYFSSVFKPSATNNPASNTPNLLRTVQPFGSIIRWVASLLYLHYLDLMDLRRGLLHRVCLHLMFVSLLTLFLVA